jgi:hypothetical protein
VSTRIQHRRGTAAVWTAANPVLAVGEPGFETDTGFEKRGDGVTAWTGLAYSQASPLGGSGVPPSPNWLLIDWTLAGSFSFTSATVNSNGAKTTGSVVWPDGATGVYTADTLSSAFPGSTDAYHVTYVWGGGSRTITQALVTRDATTGAVTAQPALTVA